MTSGLAYAAIGRAIHTEQLSADRRGSRCLPIEVKELEGGRLYYWVVWDHGPTTAAKREAAEEDPSLRVVSKRPPWVPTPDRARWPTEVQERLRGVE